MSKRRLISSYVSIAAVLAVTAWGAAVLLPLNGAAQVQIQQANFNDPSGVTVDPGGKLLHRSPVPYPASAQQKRIEGTVVISLTLNAGGTVTDVRIVSGPDELRRSVLESVLEWHYLNESESPATVQATIEFRMPQDSVPALRSTPLPPTPAPKTPQVAIRVLESIDVSNLPESLQGIVREKMTVFEGKDLTPDLLREIFNTARQVDSHLVAKPSGASATSSGVTLSMELIDNSAARARQTAPAPVIVFPPNSGVQRIRVGGDVQRRRLINMVRPVYPAKAREARIQGTVRYAVLIDKDGRIAKIQLLNGHPLLAPAAKESVEQWTYEPTLVNGQPVEVVTQVDVNFILSQ